MIIRTIILSFVSLTISLGSLFSIELSPKEQERMELIQSHYAAGQEDIWPGYAWAKSPILIGFDKNSYLIAFGLQSKNSGWEKIGAYQGISEEKLGLNLGKMQPWLPLEEKEVFFYRMSITNSLQEDLSILAHERFHRYQQESFAPIEFGQSMDHLNEENLTLSEIEDLLLHDFHNAKGEERSERMRDLAALLQFRQNSLKKGSVDWENHQMKMEGLADYVGTREYGGRAQLLYKHPIKETKPSYIEDLIKWRYYLLGASVAYALDDLQVKNWKTEVEKGADLTTLFFKAVNLSQEEQALRVDQIRKKYDYAKRRKKMEEIAGQFKEKLKKIYASYEEKSGVPLYIDRPSNQAVSGGGMNRDLVHLNDGSTVGLVDRSVSQTQDGKWVFKTEFVSHLFQHTDGVREVKLSEETMVNFDNQTIPVSELLKNPSEYSFHTIKIECQEYTLESKDHPGKLVSDGETIQINYS